MLIRADDDVARLRNMWLGPDKSLRWPCDWTCPEWAVAITGAVVGWVVSVAVAWVLWGLFATTGALQLFLAVIVAVPAGPGCGFLAKSRIAPILNSDRRLKWMITCWGDTVAHEVRVSGPHDPVVAAVAGGLWLFTVPFIRVVPGPGVIWSIAAAVGYTKAACWVRDHVESDDRYWTRVLEHQARAGVTEWAVEVSCPLDVRDEAGTRLPLTVLDRARVFFDLAVGLFARRKAVCS